MGQIKTDTIVQLDFIDRVKVLFGRKLKLVIIIDTLEEVSRANAHSHVELISSSDYKTLKDKPDFGLTYHPEPIPVVKENVEETTK